MAHAWTTFQEKLNVKIKSMQQIAAIWDGRTASATDLID